MRVPAQRTAADGSGLWLDDQQGQTSKTARRTAPAAGELAALTDGPWRGCWYWRADLEAQQAAARQTYRRGGTRKLGDKALYRPTERWIDHPDQGQFPGRRGRAWTYRPHTEQGTEAGPAHHGEGVARELPSLRARLRSETVSTPVAAGGSGPVSPPVPTGGSGGVAPQPRRSEAARSMPERTAGGRPGPALIPR